MNLDGVWLVFSLALVGLAFAWPRRDLWLRPLTVVVALIAVGPRLWSYVASPEVRGWNVFHYYLGAEYYPELGYLDLYPAALRADREGDQAFSRVTRVRNQATYEVESRAEAELRFAPPAHFTPQRWQAFVADVAALSQHERTRDWQRIFIDRGYNATPFWSSLARGITHWLPARRPVALKLLAGLDLVLLAIALLSLLTAFGWEPTLAVALLFLLSPVDGERMIGGFLQYDWLVALALGLAALRRPVTQGLRPSLLAGVAFGYATLVRVFPVLFVATLLAPRAARWVRSGRVSRRTMALVGSFVGTLLLGFALGCATPRGANAWREFVGKIGFHAQWHVYGDQRVGLQHLFTSELGNLSERTSQRQASLDRMRPVLWTVGAGLLVVAGLAALRRRGTAGFLVGLVPFYVLTVASRYYWAVLAFLPLGGRGARSLPRALGLVGLVYAAFYAARLAGSGRYGSYLVFDAALLLLAVTLLAVSLRRDLGALARLRRLRAAGQ